MNVPVKIFDKHSKKIFTTEEAKKLGIFLGVDGFPMQVTDLGVKKIEDCVVLQRTGFSCSNGEDIYEGDIVESEVPIDLTSSFVLSIQPALVRWDYLNARWYFHLNKSIMVSGDYDIKATKVLGNTYPDPDLFKIKPHA